MPLLARITIFPPQPGAFRPSTFQELVQHRIDMPGLDSRYQHTLLAAEVADDGNSAELLVHSEPVAALSLDRHMRPVYGTPETRIRALDEAGQELAAGTFAAPLQLGQEVKVGEDHYHVAGVDWPYRNEHGVCIGELDWQYVTLQPSPQPLMQPTLDDTPEDTA